MQEEGQEGENPAAEVRDGVSPSNLHSQNDAAVPGAQVDVGEAAAQAGCSDNAGPTLDPEV